MHRSPMTPKGFQILSDELKLLREVQRPENVRAIEEARAHGDISENAEFAAAKDRQSHLDGRIREVEARLSVAEVIDVRKLAPSDKVIFGATVLVRDLSTEEQTVFRIVGTEEADARKGLISHSSPLGRSLVGRSEGDEVRVDTPGGKREFEILSVKYI
jgi:transcription elongation factor GreA